MSIRVTLSGIIIVISFLQPEKAPFGIITHAEDKIIVFKLLVSPSLK